MQDSSTPSEDADIGGESAEEERNEARMDSKEEERGRGANVGNNTGVGEDEKGGGLSPGESGEALRLS